jgi:hypothetical protein
MKVITMTLETTPRDVDHLHTNSIEEKVDKALIGPNQTL